MASGILDDLHLCSLLVAGPGADERKVAATRALLRDTMYMALRRVDMHCGKGKTIPKRLLTGMMRELDKLRRLG